MYQASGTTPNTPQEAPACTVVLSHLLMSLTSICNRKISASWVTGYMMGRRIEPSADTQANHKSVRTFLSSLTRQQSAVMYDQAEVMCTLHIHYCVNGAGRKLDTGRRQQGKAYRFRGVVLAGRAAELLPSAEVAGLGGVGQPPPCHLRSNTSSTSLQAKSDTLAAW